MTQVFDTFERDLVKLVLGLRKIVEFKIDKDWMSWQNQGKSFELTDGRQEY